MVNIIIPYYNDKKGIQEALESLKNQTKKMFIVTIVDDNSPEDIQEIVNGENANIENVLSVKDKDNEMSFLEAIYPGLLTKNAAGNKVVDIREYL